MTLEQKKLIACAELDGKSIRKAANAETFALFDGDNRVTNYYIDKTLAISFLHYGTSLDAIVPVVQKQSLKIRKAVFDAIYYRTPFEDYFSITAAQILDAFLLAAGKMPKGDDK